ncbi:MAG: hypothetical protein JO316_21600 [Abitibacteriaceae bacterium]|nr:hypothetical protein [Abditibacteriaceae bacterium]MBV9867959.1 hypothetical protein [Abditibacteriaceae bacterium]
MNLSTNHQHPDPADEEETPPEPPVEQPVDEGEIIVRWVIIATVVCFVLGIIFMVLNEHFSPYR